MAVTEKDFTLSWGDITIGAPNTIAVTRPSSQYSFRFRCEFQGVTINLTAPELTVVSQDDTRVVFQWTPDESHSRQRVRHGNADHDGGLHQQV